MLEEEYRKKFEKKYKRFSKKLTRYLLKHGIGNEFGICGKRIRISSHPEKKYTFLGIPCCWYKEKSMPNDGFDNTELGKMLNTYCEENKLQREGNYQMVPYPCKTLCVLTSLKVSFLTDEVIAKASKKPTVTVTGLVDNSFLDF